MALVRLARFHATMYHFVESYPGGMDQLFQDHPWFKFKTFFDIMGDDNSKAFEGWMRSVITQVKESLRAGGRPDLSKSLDKNTNDWMMRAKTAGTPRAESFRTLVHGDYWYTNMMFK